MKKKTVLVLFLLLSGSVVWVVKLTKVFDKSGAPPTTRHTPPATLSRHITSTNINDDVDKKTNPTVLKPNSIKMGQGATAEIKIDHGLPKIDWLKGEKYSPVVKQAQANGALGAVTFLVVDDHGVPVPEAAVRGGFYNHGKNGYGFETQTDGNGFVVLQNKCAGDVNFIINKEGYYETCLRYWFFKANYDCVKDGRWIPWNPTIEVTLKQIDLLGN